LGETAALAVTCNHWSRLVRDLWVHTLILIFWGSLMPISGAIAAEPKARPPAGYDRPAANPHQSRSVVVAQSGIVATSQPLAAQAGLDILKAGGNAADAAIAANAVVGLTEPMSCGIGGDLFVIYWDAKTKNLYGLNASGRSPYAVDRAALVAKGLKEIPESGPLSWSVPGCVDGWEKLRKRFGTKGHAELLKPAINYATQGFPVSDIIAHGWQGSAKALSEWPDSAQTYLPGGRAPEEGEVFKNPNLARSYQLIAQQGHDAFYRGEIAAKIVAFSEKNGGNFSLKDFADHRSEWIEPVSTNYRGYDVWELPPNGQGIAVLEMLNVLEAYDLKSMGPFSPDYLHLFIEAKKLAFADRARFYADPEFARVPVKELISKEYAARQRQRIDPDKAALDVPPGDPLLAYGDTIYLTVVDKDRNCCSFIQSNYFGFGSQMVPGDLGFVLQNRGCLFSLDEQHPNRLEPHKRPFHTIIPGFVTKDGQPWLSLGVMGGDMQPQGHVQVLIDILDFGMNVQEAGDAARIQHFGSPTPTGRTMAPEGGTVGAESGIPEATIEALKKKGHKFVSTPGTFGGYQAIFIDHKHGTLHGGSDPRKDGCAVGY
jgi:gamma-glutamyltranspeptidase/glutathione hydrolase